MVEKELSKRTKMNMKSLLGEVANALSDGISREAVGLIFFTD